jgi:hypothetical protein
VGEKDAWAESVVVGGLSLRSLSIAAQSFSFFFLTNFPIAILATLKIKRIYFTQLYK